MKDFLYIEVWGERFLENTENYHNKSSNYKGSEKKTDGIDVSFIKFDYVKKNVFFFSDCDFRSRIKSFFLKMKSEIMRNFF